MASTYRRFKWDRASKDFFTLFLDFDRYLASDWVLTKGGAATEALQQTNGGRLLLTNAAADDNRDCLQWAGGAGAVIRNFIPTVGKKLQFVFRGQISDAVQSDLLVGLHAIATDPVGTAPTDGIYFQKDDGAARLFLVTRKANVQTKTDLGIDLVAAQDFELEFYYDGGSKDRIIAYVNLNAAGGAVATNTILVPGANVTTNVPFTTALALSMLIQNGEAVAKTMNVDYIGASIQR